MAGESQIPIASEGASRRFAARLALFYGASFGMIGTHLPFFTVWLKAIGIDASWIGIISAIPAVTRFTTLPVVTGSAEKRYSLRGALIATSFLTALLFSITGTQVQALAVFLAYAATCCVWTPMVPLTDAYALRGVARYGLNYGPLRLWGSAAFVVGALACGLLVDIIAARHLIWVIAAVAALSAAISLGLRPLERPKTATAAVHGAKEQVLGRIEAAGGGARKPGGIADFDLRYRRRQAPNASGGHLPELWPGADTVQRVFRQAEPEPAAGTEFAAAKGAWFEIGEDSHHTDLRAGFERDVGAGSIPARRG